MSGHLSSWVAVVVLVLVPQSKLLWECLLDHLVSHLLTHTLDKDSKIIVFMSNAQTGDRTNFYCTEEKLISGTHSDDRGPVRYCRWAAGGLS